VTVVRLATAALSCVAPAVVEALLCWLSLPGLAVILVGPLDFLLLEYLDTHVLDVGELLVDSRAEGLCWLGMLLALKVDWLEGVMQWLGPWRGVGRCWEDSHVCSVEGLAWR
jgi:hypothetical protein